MDAVTGMSFEAAQRLWLLVLVVPVFALLLRAESYRRDAADRFVSERMRGLSNGIRGSRPYLISFSIALAIFSTSGPQLGTELREMPVFESSTVLVLDLSASMEARDLGASRFSAAKALAGRILERTSGRVGLVVYEGSAEIVSPLTEDHAAVNSLVQSLHTGELDAAGSDLSLALEAALDLASKGGNRSTDVVFISDGEHRGRAWDEQLAIARTRGVRVSAILLGTQEGGAIPVGNDESLRDDSGAVVISRTSTEPLKTIVEDCGGEIWVNPFGEGTLANLQRNVGQFSGGDRFERIPVERFQWPLGASLLLFLASAVVNRGAE